MIPVVLLLGLVATMLGWRAVNRGREVWRTLPPILAVFGLISLFLYRSLDAPPPGGANVPGPLGVALIGLASGAIFYVATRIFVVLAQRVPAFRRQTEAAYGKAGTADRVRELVLSLALAVPGEELLWRGLAYRWGADQLSSLAVAAVLVWAVYVLANVPSRSLPIIAGAMVGGALWGALAWWTGGVLAPLASHILWTGSMLALPPKVGRTEGDG